MPSSARRNQKNAPIALSLKQPWAALVVLGYKTIEVRTWTTSYRGALLIHAARQPDTRSVPWPIPDNARRLAELRGGILGRVELVDCLQYRDREQFVLDSALHWNLPEWFAPPCMYGFVFRRPQLLPFVPCSGWFRLFRVPAFAVRQLKSGRQDSNLRPPGPKPGALAKLSYAPMVLDDFCSFVNRGPSRHC
jgi:hypothetical protein